MELDQKQSEMVKDAVKKVIEDTFSSKIFLKRMKKEIINSFNSVSNEKINARITTEDTIVEKYVKISKPTDAVWKDLSAAAIQTELIINYPKLQGKISTMKLGRALSSAGALKGMKNGIAMYRIKKINKK